MASLSVTGQIAVTGTEDDSGAVGELWDDALRVYKSLTGIDLKGDNTDLARRLAHCKNESDVLDAIEVAAKAFSKYREGSPRLKKLRNMLKPVVRVVLLLNDAGAEGATSKVRRFHDYSTYMCSRLDLCSLFREAKPSSWRWEFCSR
jgi:hypothetical protein